MSHLQAPQGDRRDPRSRLETLAAEAPDWLLAAYLVLLPFFHLRPWSRVATACLLAAAALAVAAAARRRSLALPRSPVLVLLVAYTLACAASVLLSGRLAESARDFWRVPFKALLVALLIAREPLGPARARRIVAALATSAAGLAAVAGAMWAAGTRNPWGGLTGPEIQYTSVCLFLVATVPFVWLLGAEPGPRGWAWTAAGAGVTAAVLLTFSRLGWAAFAVAAAVRLAGSRTGRARLAGVLAAGAAAAALAAPDLAMLSRVTDTPRLLAGAHQGFDRSALKAMSWRDVLTLDGRVEFGWKPALAIVAAHPVLGAGFGPGTFAREARGRGPVLDHEHDALLSVAVQSGLVGAAAYLALLLAAAASLARAARAPDPGSPWPGGVALAALAALLAAYVVNAVGEPTNTGRMGILFGALVGLAAAARAARGAPEE